MSKFLSKKYGVSNFAIEHIKFMCEDFTYMLLSFIECDNKDFGDDDWDVTKYPKHSKGYGPMGFGPMGRGMWAGRYGHVNNKKARDISKRIETTVFEILEDIKKNDKRYEEK